MDAAGWICVIAMIFARRIADPDSYGLILLLLLRFVRIWTTKETVL